MPHPADRPIGWELAARYPHLYRDGPLPSRPKPCPVCGHPTGSCTKEDHEIMVKNTSRSASRSAEPAAAKSDQPDPVRVALQGGRRTAEEANRRAIDSLPPGPAQVVIKEDVYEDVTDPNAVTKRRVLRFHKGQVVPEDVAKAAGVTAVQQQDVRGAETK